MKTANFYFSGRSVSKILLSELRSLKNKKRILDDGCGDGVMLKDLKSLGFLSDHIIYAIDISAKNIETARNRFRKVRFKRADARKLPFKNGYFDFVYSWMVIEHVENMGAMVSEIKRVLKPSGVCYVSSVIKLPWAIYFYRRNSKFVIDPSHLHEFESVKEFVDLFKKQNFKLIRVGKEQTRYSVLELFIKILLKLKILKESVKLRDVFTNSRSLEIIRRLTTVPIPGFYHVEGLFGKSGVARKRHK